MIILYVLTYIVNLLIVVAVPVLLTQKKVRNYIKECKGKYPKETLPILGVCAMFYVWISSIEGVLL